MTTDGPAATSTDDSSPANPHVGGFRDDFGFNTERGGPRYGELVEQFRVLMDLARAADPTPELVDGLIDQLTAVNAQLATAETDEWSSPSGRRIDLTARGNVMLPPMVMDRADATGITARVTFRRFHLGGNNAAHGGYIGTVFDDLLGMTSALATRKITRTAYLNVNYRSITQLHIEHTVETSVTRVDGRKVFVEAKMRAGEQLCAEADALFVILKPGQP
ncbi:PaaI family thioesterase [Williamsia sp. CHRR-6]|uniref:PaaI family thioesterase n=1 Tax=Williamsia sp. CHRR-6 TaxID=2835871 RepID=UPI001BD989CB|nr:PaaI family thioesterase [Williamsia sp. CHRR-6]MBT0565918.1 PaaI family thioesterase [Williamsia sp. CHRR-6]